MPGAHRAKLGVSDNARFPSAFRRLYAADVLLQMAVDSESFLLRVRHAGTGSVANAARVVSSAFPAVISAPNYERR